MVFVISKFKFISRQECGVFLTKPIQIAVRDYFLTIMFTETTFHFPEYMK